MGKTLDHLDTLGVTLEDENGNLVTGRIIGVEIAADEMKDVHVYFTADRRVFVYDGVQREAHDIKEPSELRDWLDSDSYVMAMDTLEREAGVHL